MYHHTQYSLDRSDQQRARTVAQTWIVQSMWKHKKSQLTRNIPAGFIYPVNRRSVKLSFLSCKITKNDPAIMKQEDLGLEYDLMMLPIPTPERTVAFFIIAVKHD